MRYCHVTLGWAEVCDTRLFKQTYKFLNQLLSIILRCRGELYLNLLVTAS